MYIYIYIDIHIYIMYMSMCIYIHKLTRPRAGWLRKLVSAAAGRQAAVPISGADISAVFARVAAAAPSLGDWEHQACETLAEVVAGHGSGVAGEVVSRTEHSSLDATEVVLSNGMRVVLKHTRFLDDEVQFKAFAYGGLSELDGLDKVHACMCVCVCVWRLRTAVSRSLMACTRCA